MQATVARLFDFYDEIVRFNNTVFAANRTDMYNSLKNAGMNPFMPEGTFFMVCDISALTRKSDEQFCLDLLETCNVAALPLSSFMPNPNDHRKLIRLCFGKSSETVTEGLRRLSSFQNSSSKIAAALTNDFGLGVQHGE
jgi:N-succinyldiaminopimelate aminotransferase